MGVGAWPDGFHAAFVDHQKAQGRAGFSLEPVCEQAAPQVQLCLVVTDGGRRRPVTLADLQAWGETPAETRARAVARARAAFASSVTPVDVAGVGAYRVRSAGDGLDAAGLLLGPTLAAEVGAPLRVAIPARGSLLYWKGDDGDLDRVVAVGVARIHEQAGQPVSDQVLEWTDGGWVVWGRAQAPRAPAAP